MNQKNVLIYGPMFAGKSNKLISYYQTIPYQHVLIFKPRIDVRTQEIFSRTGKRLQAISITSWEEIYLYINNLNTIPSAIFIDEAQFIEDEKEDVFEKLLNSIKEKNIDIYVSTLNKDFLGNEFDFFKRYNNLFDSHIVLSSICKYCSMMAFNTNKMRNNKLITIYDNLFEIDEKKSNVEYIPVCTLHHLYKNSN